MEIRKFENGKTQEITKLFFETFSDSEGEEEGVLIKELVSELFEYVHTNEARAYFAQDTEGKVIGAVFFSPLNYEDNEVVWMLSPMAVKTSEQGKGIGQAIIKFALRDLAEDGVKSACTYGDPAFYEKVGFEPVTTDKLPSPLPLSFPEGWLWNSFGNFQELKGIPRCLAPFGSADLW